LAALAVPHAASGLLLGSRFLGGDPWLASIVEFKPLFFSGWKSVPAQLAQLGGGLLLAVYYVSTTRRRLSTEATVLLLFIAVYVGATLSSQRFLVCAAPLLAIAGARISGRLLATRGPTLAGIAAALVLVPWMVLAVDEVRDAPPNFPDQARPFLRAAMAIRDRGPGRVLCPWSWGHVFHVIGGRGVLVDGFGAMLGRGEFENAVGALLVTREEHLADFCRRFGVRWVVLDNPVTHLTVEAQSIGLSTRHFVIPGKPARITPRMRFSFWWRAYFDRGQVVREPGRFSPEFRFFKLVYADPQLSDGPARYRGSVAQVWELVSP
jgi:hypothetical protein